MSTTRMTGTLLIWVCGLFLLSVGCSGVAQNWNKPKLNKLQLPATFNYDRYWVPPVSLPNSCTAWRGTVELGKSARRTQARNLINAARYFNGLLMKSLMAKSTVERSIHKEIVLEWARNRYFSEPYMETKWSPVYVQSNIIRTSAFYITHLETLGELTESEKSEIVAWIQPMLRYQKGRKMNGSDDSRAASGVALIAWGSVSRDEDLVQRGIKQWSEGIPYVLSSVGGLKRQAAHRGVPKTSLSLEDEFNLTLAHVVEGAVILENLGVENIFSTNLDGVSLSDAIDWWIPQIIDPSPSFKGARRLRSHNWHVGWLPIYISNPRADVTTGQVAHLIKEITRYGSFEAISLGGATDCLWSFPRNYAENAKRK